MPETTQRDSIVNRPADPPTPSSALGGVRQAVKVLTETVTTAEHTARSSQLAEAASLLGKRDPRELLDDLANTWGLSWNTIATMLGVTPSAVRKWRRGGAIAPENRHQVALLTAFITMLQSVKEPIADIGSWIAMRIHEESTLTPATIYARGADGRLLLLDWAAEHITTTAMLEAVNPEWRTSDPSDPSFRVTDQGPGGERAIVPR
ncbi:MAG: hypothetical protein ACR2KV_07900 [Solirubrobacteraceae bacterium]